MRMVAVYSEVNVVYSVFPRTESTGGPLSAEGLHLPVVTAGTVLPTSG